MATSEDDPTVFIGPPSGSEEPPTNGDHNGMTTAGAGNIGLHFRLRRHRPGGTTRVVAIGGRDAAIGPGGMAFSTTMLPPLEPRPMPYQATGPSESASSVDESEGGEAEGRGIPDINNDDDNATDTSRFECAVCYEFMENPFRCGNASCTSRFCQTCLQRVLHQSTSSGTSPELTDPPPPNSARCPNCRSFFSTVSASADDDLRREIRDCDCTVPCQFLGCGAKLKLRDHVAHESNCPHARMGCRYGDWGCRWVGRRMDLADHDANACEFRRGLGVLVERFRRHDDAIRREFHQHRARIGASSQMIALHSRQIMMARARNPYNAFDVLWLAYQVALFPGRSAMQGFQRDARCVVYNVLLLLPSLAMAFNIAFRSLRLLSGIHLNKLSGDDMWFIVDALLLSIIVSMLGILCVACFFIDNKGPMEWTVYNVRNNIPGQLMLRDLACICMAMLHFSAIEFLGLHPGLMLWHSAAFVTIFHSSFVSFIVEKLAPPSSIAARTTMRTGRAWPVVVFGLRYGLLAAMGGFAPSINAVVALRLLGRVGAVSPVVTGEDSECFVTHFGTGLLITLSGFATAFEYVDQVSEAGLWRTILRDWAFALATLAYANALVYVLEVAGNVLGEKNFHMGNRLSAQSQQHAQGGGLLFIKPCAIGCSVCAACSFLMIIITAG